MTSQERNAPDLVSRANDQSRGLFYPINASDVEGIDGGGGVEDGHLLDDDRLDLLVRVCRLGVDGFDDFAGLGADVQDIVLLAVHCLDLWQRLVTFTTQSTSYILTSTDFTNG